MKKIHFLNLSFFTVRLLSALIFFSVSTLLVISSAAQENALQPLPRLPSNWLAVDSPNSPNGNTALGGVTCTASNDCWAIGTSFEHWDGNAWSVVDSSTLGSANGVACAASNDCWAVGVNYSTQTPLIQHWDGQSWTVTSNVPGAGDYSGLSGVTCTSGSNCWAVGYYHTPQLGIVSLIEHWNGSAWQYVFSPNGSLSAINKYIGVSNSTLSSVACASESKCFAVGSYTNNSSTTTMIEQWDGTSWTVVPSAALTLASVSEKDYEDAVLTSITCPSAVECWAVGYSAVPDDSITDDSQPLFEHWIGGAWYFVSSPTLGNVDKHYSAVTFNSYPWNYLLSVQCSSATQCWAVGFSRAGAGYGASQTLIEQWDGAAWAPVVSPNSSASDTNFLRGVTCAPGSECWAVGSYMLTDGSQRSLILLNP